MFSSDQWLLKFGIFGIYYAGFSELLFTYVKTSIICYWFHTDRIFIYVLVNSVSNMYSITNSSNDKNLQRINGKFTLSVPVVEKTLFFVKWSHGGKVNNKICKQLEMLNRNSSKQLPTEALCLWTWVTIYYQKMKWYLAEWMTKESDPLYVQATDSSRGCAAEIPPKAMTESLCFFTM